MIYNIIIVVVNLNCGCQKETKLVQLQTKRV